MLRVSYDDDRERAQRILLDAATHHAMRPEQVEAEMARNVERRYGLRTEQFVPRVYWRVTVNWLEMTVRFVVRETEVRAVKDAIARELLRALDAAGIGIASATSEIVGFPPLRAQVDARWAPDATD